MPYKRNSKHESLPSPKNRQRIFDELDKLLTDTTQLDFKKFQGRDGHRLRVGDYRVLIQVQRQEWLFIVTNIGPRGDVYR